MSQKGSDKKGGPLRILKFKLLSEGSGTLSKDRLSFGIAVCDIVTAGIICMNICDRCKHSQGGFKDLSTRAFNLHAILAIVQDSWRTQNLLEENQMKLKGLMVPVSELLGELESRLLKYASLGTKMPGICDQIG